MRSSETFTIKVYICRFPPFKLIEQEIILMMEIITKSLLYGNGVEYVNFCINLGRSMRLMEIVKKLGGDEKKEAPRIHRHLKNLVKEGLVDYDPKEKKILSINCRRALDGL